MCTKRLIGEELKRELSQGYNIQRISSLAAHWYVSYRREQTVSGLRSGDSTSDKKESHDLRPDMGWHEVPKNLQLSSVKFQKFFHPLFLLTWI